jgi:WD40 repeat protein
MTIRRPYPLALALVFAAPVCAGLYIILAGDETERIAFKSDGADFTRTIAFSPDSKLIAAGQVNGAIKIWEVASGKEWASVPGQQLPPFDAGPIHEVTTLHLGSIITALAFHPDGELLAWGDMGGTVTLFNTKSKKKAAQWLGKVGDTDALAFHPHGKYLAVGTDWGFLGFWDLAGNKYERVFEAKKKDPTDIIQPKMRCLAFDSTGKTLAAGSDRSLFFLDVTDGVKIRAVKEVSGSTIESLAFTPDSKILAAGGHPVTLWDTATAKEVGTIPLLPKSIAFSPDGKKLAIAIRDRNDFPNQVKIWALDEQRVILEFVCHTNHFGVAWSPNGETLATVSDDAVKLWDISAMLTKAGK